MNPGFIFIYLVTIFVASITPGPSMLLALDHGVRYGARRTIASALGNVAATLLQASLSIAGLETILFRSETVFGIVKYLGAAYLILLGVSTFFSSSGPPTKHEEPLTGKYRKNLFVEAFVVTMGNPKAVLFFTALFPQFVNTREEGFLQFLAIISLLLVTTFICMMIYGFFGHRIAHLLRQPRLRKRYNRIIGGTFIVMGIGLATARTE